MRRTALYIFVPLLALLSACTGMKNISSNDPLYVGYEIHYTETDAEKKTLNPQIKDVMKPKPNNTFLWMRPALARYNMLSEKRRKKKFWKNKVTPPVTLSQTEPNQVATAIHNRIFHNGYFKNEVTYDTVLVGDKKGKYRYLITLRQPYRYESVVFPNPKAEDDLMKKISAQEDQSLLKVGDIYTLDAVKNERTRIDRNLKEDGYIYFNPDFISVKADSVSGDHQIKAELTVKPETPPESRKAFTIRNVYIHDNHLMEGSSPDTTVLGNYYLISQDKSLNFEVLQRGVFIKPGERYAYSNYIHTVRYMNGLPIIRNANMKFTPVGNTDDIDVTLYLFQRKRYAYTAEFNTIFRSTNYFGPGIVFSYTDRNLKRGAEMLKINLRGRFEVQISQGVVNPAYELGLEANYTLPRFYPGFLFNVAKKSLPKTNVSMGYNLFNRLDLYRLNSVFANFGYRWSKTERFSHSFNPIEVIFTKIPEASKSEEFNIYLEENPGVKRSFDEQFIVGSAYEFTYQAPPTNRNQLFFRGGIDFAGNLLNALYSITNAKKDSLGRYNLLGVPFSQYVRLRVDLRYGIELNERSTLVGRFSSGVGIPLANSTILPYIKQFYVGGTNSLRSFIARSVGPGSEVPPEGYNDLTGDIRLEANLEYRFDIAGSLKGALFLDVGNIWLYNDDPARPNGKFKGSTFLKEIAVSSGWGLRWDFDFIVARLDFAYTLRTPYLPEGERWATNFNFWSPALNIAIGYPF
jgi:outer membrane protein insertion porin family